MLKSDKVLVNEWAEKRATAHSNKIESWMLPCSAPKWRTTFVVVYGRSLKSFHIHSPYNYVLHLFIRSVFFFLHFFFFLGFHVMYICWSFCAFNTM